MASWTRSLRSRAASIDSSDEKAHGPLPNSAAAMASNDRGSSGTTSNIYATLRRSSQRKRPRQSVGDQGAPARKGSKSKELLSAQLLENVERAARDPYHLNDPERYPRCTLRDHLRKKNCADNPRCLFGLGEGKEGIWSANPRLLVPFRGNLSRLLTPVEGEKTISVSSDGGKPAVLGIGDETSATPPQGRLPAGLKNLGATCYLNSQLQALFANRAFRAGVYSWRPSFPRAGGHSGGTCAASGIKASVDGTDESLQTTGGKVDGDKSRNGLGVGQRGVDKTTQAFRHRRRDAIVAKQNTTTTTATRKSCVVEQISDRAINFSRGQEEVTGKNACGGCKGGDKPSSKANLADNNGVAPVKKERDSAARGKANLAGRENADVLLEVDVDSEGRGKADGFAEGWEGARNDDLIMEELQRVFGHMQAGRAKVYDPAPFANLLGIDKGIQQDPQEFNKLLMSLLEKCLQRSAPPLPGLVSGLFCGQLAYVTRCLTCNNASKRTTPFNELELQIGDNRTVEACLVGFLAEESLDGDNKYLCEQCAQKRDAVRYMELHSLPPVLSIQLLRYVYDVKTGYRKKIKAPISLTATLDMGPRLRAQGRTHGAAGIGGEESIYELGCVLYHKGNSVHFGHYVAEVRDPRSNTWTLFDDEKVRPLNGVDSPVNDSTAGVDVDGKGNDKGKSPRSNRKGGRTEKSAEPSTAGSDAEVDFLGCTIGAAQSDGDADADAEFSDGGSSTDQDARLVPATSNGKGKPKGKEKRSVQGGGDAGGGQGGGRGEGEVTRRGGKRAREAGAGGRVVQELSPDEEDDNAEDGSSHSKYFSGSGTGRKKHSARGARHEGTTSATSNPRIISGDSGGGCSGRNRNNVQNLNGRQNRRNQSAKRSGGGSGGGNSLGAEKRDEVKGIDVMAISDDEEGEESGVGRGGGRGGGRKRKKDAEAGDRMNADCNASDGADVVECDHDEEPAEDLKLVEGRGEGGGAGGNCNDGSNSAGDGRANGGKGSEDAYMLIYIRKGCRWGAASGGEDEPALPAHVQAAVEASNAALAAEVAKFVRDKHMLEEEIRARRARYTSLFGRPTNFDSTGQRKVGKSKRVGGKESAEAGDQAAVYVDGGDVLKSKAERKGGAAPASADRRDGVEQEGQEDGQDESGKVAARRWSRYRSGSYAMEAEGEDDVKDDEDGALADGGDVGAGEYGSAAAAANARERPVAHPGPSDEALSNSNGAVISDDDETERDSEEDRNMNEAIAASFGTAATTTTTARGTTADSTAKHAREERGGRDGDRAPVENGRPSSSNGRSSSSNGRSPSSDDRPSPPSPPSHLPPGDFFWVDSHWLRQWTVGEHLPNVTTGDGGQTGGAFTSPNEPCFSGKGTSSANPLVLEEVNGATRRQSRDQEASSNAPEQGVVEVFGSDCGRDVDAKVVNSGDRRGTGATGDGACAVGGMVEIEGHTGAGARVRPKRAGDSTGGVSRGARHDRMGTIETSDSVNDAVREAVKGVDDKVSSPIPMREDNSEGNLEISPKVNSDTNAERSSERFGEIELEESTDEMSAAKANAGASPPWNQNPAEHRDDQGTTLGDRPGSLCGASVSCQEGVFREPMRHVHLLCEHGGLHPASVSRLKVVTRKVYEGFLTEDGMPWPDYHLAASNYRCERCVKNHIGQKENNMAASIQSGELVAALEEPEPPWHEAGGKWDFEGGVEERPFVISRKWVADFKTYHGQFLRSAAKMQSAASGGAVGVAGKLKAGAKLPPDERVNSNITCEHGKLMSSRRGAQRKYRVISASGWRAVLERFPRAAALQYPAGTPPCTKCQEQDKDDNQLKLERRNAKSLELTNGPSLKGLWRRDGALPTKLSNPPRGLSSRQDESAPGDRFFLAQSWWLDRWRAYHNSNSILLDPPGPLLNQGLRCKHGLAIMGPRLRQVVEGSIPAGAVALEDGTEVLTEPEWRDLWRLYCVSEEDAHEGVLNGVNFVDEGGEEGVEAAEGGWGAGGGATFEVSFSASTGWTPAVCKECMAAASNRADMERSVFQNKDVTVIRLKEGEDPPVPDPASVALGLGGTARSSSGRPQRRTRGKGNGGGVPLAVTCCSDDTIAVLKLKVFQLTDVVPNRQTLFHAGVPLTDAADTLQLAGIKAGATLHLQVGESNGALVDDTQLYTEALSTKPPPGPELGFAGTALSGTRRPTPPPFFLPGAAEAGGEGVKREGAKGEGSSTTSPLAVDGNGDDGGIVIVHCPKCTMENDIGGGCVTHCSVCRSTLFA